MITRSHSKLEPYFIVDFDEYVNSMDIFDYCFDENYS
jgi:hypothetical protein